jgi:hypothetical protein
MVRPALARTVACAVLVAAVAGCGASGAGDVQAGSDTTAAATSTATPHRHRPYCDKIDLAAISADKADRVPDTTLAASVRARVVLTPDDPKSFIAKVTKEQLVSAGISGAGQMPNDLVLVVNHGSWARSDLALKAPPGAPAVAARPIVWRASIYDPAKQKVIKRFGGPDTPCFKGF